MALKHLGFTVTQGWSPEAEERAPSPGEIGVLKLSAISSGIFDERQVKTLRPEDEARASAYLLRNGDVLVVRASGSLRLLGTVAQVVRLGSGRLIYPDLVYRIEPRNPRIDVSLLPTLMRSGAGRKAIEEAKRGAANNKLRQEDVRNLRLPAPLDESVTQRLREIIEREGRLTHRLGADAAAMAEALDEYRDALITEAVTGQLNVSRMSEQRMEESAAAALEGAQPEVLAT